ncbi:MAG: hypothetical protein JSV76_00465 [Candidatus Bathyarchaeota archaeon]|nr:MAG: hypothetical protein JSV76_00465 [Candidatus Bathyarchaeota archaeon]
MKKITIYIGQHSINKIIGSNLELLLPDEANIIDVIDEVDKTISSKAQFPSEHYHSLLHWVYNPIEERFYKQAAITAYAIPRQFLKVKNNPKMNLPDGAIVYLLPDGPCITKGEEVLDYDTFIQNN